MPCVCRAVAAEDAMPFTEETAKEASIKGHEARWGDGLAEPLPEDDGQATIQEAVRWVLAHVGDAGAKTPTRLARAIQRYAKKNEQGFMDKYVPVLMKSEKPE